MGDVDVVAEANEIWTDAEQAVIDADSAFRHARVVNGAVFNLDVAVAAHRVKTAEAARARAKRVRDHIERLEAKEAVADKLVTNLADELNRFVTDPTYSNQNWVIELFARVAEFQNPTQGDSK